MISFDQALRGHPRGEANYNHGESSWVGSAGWP